LTNFLNSFALGLSKKFEERPLLYSTTLLVTTLPYEIQKIKIAEIRRI